MSFKTLSHNTEDGKTDYSPITHTHSLDDHFPDSHLLLFFSSGEAKNIPPYPGPNKMRDCYCTVNLDQEEVFRTKIIEKSLW